jgi:UDP-GlcNAc:undecaprenyl-phosphate GlcNAc-1-phosphate transferase
MWSLGLQVLVISAVVSFLATPVAIRLGNTWGAVDLPGPRKVHTQPIPRVGGMSVFLGIAAGLAYGAFATGFLPGNLQEKGLHWGSLALAAFAVFVMGLVDDVHGLSFRWKFAVQIAAAVLVWQFGFRIESLAIPMSLGTVNLGILSAPVTVLWIVGVTNAINMIDGLDGLAAGMALICTTAVATIALYREQVAVTAASVAIVGSLVGFLRYNFSPARVFLGDSGSMLLGFLLAVLSIHANQKGATAVAVLAPVLVLGIPLLDTGLAILRRLYRLQKSRPGSIRGVPYLLRNATVVFLPDRAHLHHRLLDLGLSQRAAVIALYLGAVLTGFAALSLVILRNRVLAMGLLAILVGLLLVFWGFALAGRRPPSGPPPPGVWKTALGDPTATPPE